MLLARELTLLMVAVGATPAPVAPQDSLLVLKARLMRATYEGHLDTLAAVAEELGRFTADTTVAWLAQYHAGFAHYVLALMTGPNGLLSPRGDPDRSARQVDLALVRLEAAVLAEPRSAEAHALLSQVYAMKLRTNPLELREQLGPKGRAAMARALALQPDNPRVALIDAMRLFWAPPAAGGNRVRGLERWKEATELFLRESGADSSPRPSWGHAEVWAWLANALAAIEPPDTTGARRAVERALDIRPDFRWVRVSLVPRVEAMIDQRR